MFCNRNEPLAFSMAIMNLSVSWSRFWLTTLSLLLAVIAWGQRAVPAVQDTSKDKFIKIDYVGKMLQDIHGEDVKWLSQGLQLRIDSTNIYADSAVIYGDERVLAYGNVIIQQGIPSKFLQIHCIIPKKQI